MNKVEELFPEQLELFEKPIVRKAIEASFYNHVAPSSTKLDADPLEFYYTSSEYYIDPSDVYLYLKRKIESSKTVSTDVAGPVNCFFYALFERIEVELNGVPIDAGFNNLPYKGYFKSLFNSEYGVRETTPRGILWQEDTAEKFDDEDPVNGLSIGLKDRYLITKDKKEFEMYGRPMHELFYMNSFILPKASLKIKLYRTKPKFGLMSGATNLDF